ncbi:MAG: bifunctional methylenetetrahydrofolate dehydrogenase/methenyltetrahydrofolate cyclohydrolase FolD [Rickettsiales bacterium]|nr:bifunctional methylenetetrahydrofolate dehydrogenase/methenyltetrahydrofolate cyclohydrolase FolD [Rickettsiales bacterium]
MELSEIQDHVASQMIDGKAAAAALRLKIATQVSQLRERHGVTPGLAVVLVGDHAASQVYVKNKEKMAAEVGMHSFHHDLPADTSTEQLLAKVETLNADAAVHGILVQLPLPRASDERLVIEAIDPRKDVDGFHPINAGRLSIGEEALIPCTPLGCLILLKQRLGDLTGMHAVVIGRSNIVGKPMAALLLRENCTVTMVHSKSRYIKEETRRADILIAAVGRPEMVEAGWIKPGATVIDVGINRISLPNGSSRLVGDVAYTEALEVAAGITPVPGGVGPMTIACLLHNTLKAACMQHGLPFEFSYHE